MRHIVKNACVIAAALLLTGCGASKSDEMVSRSIAQIESGNYESALSFAEDAITYDNDLVLAQRAKGLALIGLGRYQEALEALDAAYEATDNKMPETRKDLLLYRLYAEVQMSDYEKAVQTADSIVAEYGKSAEVSFQLGCCYLGLSDQDSARENFDEAVSLDPRNYGQYLEIYHVFSSYALSAVGDEYLQQALNVIPEDNDDRYAIGNIYYTLEKYDEAADAVAQAAADGHVASSALLGRIYLAQGSTSQAREVFQKLLDGQGESTQAYNGLALCALKENDPDGAIAYIESGLALDGEEGKQDLRWSEIAAYEQKEDYAAARVKAEAYAALYPADEAGQKEWQFLSTR